MISFVLTNSFVLKKFSLKSYSRSTQYPNNVSILSYVEILEFPSRSVKNFPGHQALSVRW